MIFQRGRYTTNQENMRARLQQHLEVFAIEGNSWAAARAASLTPDTVQAGPRGGVEFEYPLVN